MSRTNRRQFIKNTSVISAGFWIAGHSTSFADETSPNEKLNIAIIGAGGKGESNLNDVKSQNIVALCDVDEQRAAKAFEQFPNAKKYHDFRKLLQEEEKNIDAVVVSTPDHCHAPASVMAMKMGKHVYCEKPLTHSVFEARVMRETAAQMKVATQMGNQGTAAPGFRKGVSMIRSGQALGPVREVHVWTNRPIWGQGLERPTETPSVPNTMDWYLWLGPAPDRPYNPCYAPFSWRGWWDFGTGALGDMACHTMNLAFMGLQLGYPTAVEAESGGATSESGPQWSVIRYEFPARGDMPPVKLTWYDGKDGDQQKLPPAELAPGQKLAGSGLLLVGEKATLFSPNDYGANFKLLPESDYADFKVPESDLPKSPGHHREWIEACKGGAPALSNFDYAGMFTETVLLGNVATRVGKRIEWDGPNLRSTNCPEAEQYIKREYRKGWTL